MHTYPKNFLKEKEILARFFKASITRSRFFKACINGDLDSIRSQLELNPLLINARNNKGETPIFIAAENGQVGAIRMLASFGGDPYIGRYDGATPLYIAAQNGHVEVI